MKIIILLMESLRFLWMFGMETTGSLSNRKIVKKKMTPSLRFVLGFFNSSTRPHLPLPKLQKFKKDKSKSLYEQWTCGRVHVSLSVFLSLSLPFCLFQFNIECELTCFVNLFLFRFSVCFFLGGKMRREEDRIWVFCVSSLDIFIL